MITADRQIFPIKVMDVPGLGDDEQLLHECMMETVTELKDEYKVDVVAIVADAAAACRKACRMTAEALPGIITLDCAAHQLDLILSSCLKNAGPISDSIRRVVSMCVWWSSHQTWNARLEEHIEAKFGQETPLLLPVKTHWGSCVTALARALEVSREKTPKMV